MPVVLSSPSLVPSCHVNHLRVNALSDPNYTFLPCNTAWKLCFTNKTVTVLHKKKFPKTLKFIPAKCTNSSTNFFGEENGVANDWIDQEEPGDMDSPWEGAVLYQRDPSITHVEYCTTLERLGFGKFSTDVSKSRASLMGIRVTKAVKDFPHGTPVLISIDVTRKKRKLRLDGIIRTVLTLGCIRCGKPAAECVYSNFSLLLTEDPVEEPEIIDMGVIYREDKLRSISSEEGEDDDDSIDFDDRLHFPPHEKLIDISKNIRDTVHVEIVMTAVCDPTCKGFCINCGTDLNTGSCVCSKQKVKEKGYGPFGGLREKMQQN